MLFLPEIQIETMNQHTGFFEMLFPFTSEPIDPGILRLAYSHVGIAEVHYRQASADFNFQDQLFINVSGDSLINLYRDTELLSSTGYYRQPQSRNLGGVSFSYPTRAEVTTVPGSLNNFHRVSFRLVESTTSSLLPNFYVRQ